MGVVLGINTHHAGASAAVVIDGKPAVAIAEERLNRVKYYARFPHLSIAKCLEIAGLRFRDINAIAVARDPSRNRAQKIAYVLANPTKLLNFVKIRSSRAEMDDIRSLLAKECAVDAAEMQFKEYRVEHHLAHIASAFFISPWERAAGFSIDGSGDFVTTMLADCRSDRIEIKKRVYVPHSLGFFYLMLCQLLGYDKYGDEGKVMGLAPYGTDKYVEQVEDMVKQQDGAFRLNAKYFLPFSANEEEGINDKGEMFIARQYSDEAVRLFGPPRVPYTEITQRDRDLAYAVQRVFEKTYLHMLNALHALVPQTRVAMAGGCVLNSVANGMVFTATPFQQTCIQPAAGDEGLALGAALYVSNVILKEKARFVMQDAYLGPEYSESVIRQELDRCGVKYRRLERPVLIAHTVAELLKGNIIGWFQGRMEWGPRALGNRSILAHPGLPRMKEVLNARIKRREWFRPFAPAVLAERQAEIFVHTHPSPFMLHVYTIRPEWRERLCAVNHVDNTGRLQTVAHEENALYYDLIKAFGEATGIPVLLNTSFNENEPIVCCPAEAIDCFLRTKMDVLVIGPFFCSKEVIA